MKDREHDGQPEGLSLGDIYFVLFRQKWKILFFCILGVAGVITLLALNPPVYQSQATLFIRYVVEGKSLTPPGNEQNARPLNDQEQSIINTEVRILRSFDLARQVVEVVGAEKILAAAGGGTNRDQAAGLVMKNLIVEPPVSGSVLLVTFQHPDKGIAQEVLNKVIFAYYKKHADAHQPVRIFGDFLNQETKRLHDQLAQTEQQLREAKHKAGINSPGVTSISDAKRAWADQMSKIRIDLFDAEAGLAGHQAVLDQTMNVASAKPGSTNNPEPQLPSDVVRDYRNICARLDGYSRRKQDLLFSFTDDSRLVREVDGQIVETERLKQNLEREHPQLLTLGAATLASSGQTAGIPIEAIQVRAIKSRIEVLKSQLSQIEGAATRLEEMETTISDLQRKRDLEDADLKYFSARLEQGNIDAALGTEKAPNIGIIDPPTPPKKAWPKSLKKKLAMVGVVPVCAGFALAFLIELILDTSVRRPSEVGTKLHLPLFMSIPNLKTDGLHTIGSLVRKDQLRLKDAIDDSGNKPSDKHGPLEVDSWEGNHPLRRFFEGLRDRLIVHFEVTNLTHKPKLIAVTSCGQGAGVTSLAAGLAASLSETGEGNVLFVDMNRRHQGAAQQFYKGKPGCELEDALGNETKEESMVQERLYVAAEGITGDKLPRVLHKRFKQLVPKFRASKYDYIIFDMPPVSQTSVTARMAGLVDMVLLVVESEKTNREIVKQASALLAESKADVGVVLNKTRTYVPQRLHQDRLSD